MSRLAWFALLACSCGGLSSSGEDDGARRVISDYAVSLRGKVSAINCPAE